MVGPIDAAIRRPQTLHATALMGSGVPSSGLRTSAYVNVCKCCPKDEKYLIAFLPPPPPPPLPPLPGLGLPEEPAADFGLAFASAASSFPATAKTVPSGFQKHRGFVM